jgi:hypothetical protein
MEIRVQSDEYIKSGFREAQKFAVLLSCPPCFLNSDTFVAVIDEVFFQRSRAHSSIKILI